MALGISRVTFSATFVGLAGDPVLLHWRKIGGSGTQRRPLGGAVPVPDAALLEAARAIPCGTEVELPVVTDWGTPGLPKHLEAIRVLERAAEAVAA
jgi:hypothetical protein